MPIPFPERYHEARAAFLQDAGKLEDNLGVKFAYTTEVIDAEEDLTIDAFHYTPPSQERLLVLVSGTHGLEGYTGSAIQRHLMSGILKTLKKEKVGLFFVHGLNPWGFHHYRRVNPNNVDLNRNFSDPGGAIYSKDSAAYRGVDPVLCPKEIYGGGLKASAIFAARMLKFLGGMGMAALRQATLSGQYIHPKGLFFGGGSPERESQFFMQNFEALAKVYGEILLCDFHTGYGEPGLAYPLFGRGDSAEFKKYAEAGVKSDEGADKTYTASGDLVGWAYQKAKELGPEGIFDGLVVEMGTHGLGTTKQLKDLWAVVRENQVHHYGAASDKLKAEAQSDFNALFFPTDRPWQEDVLKNAGTVVEGFLRSRDFVNS